MPTILPVNGSLDATTIASASLWSLALYLGFSPMVIGLETRLARWIMAAKQSSTTLNQGDHTQQHNESPIAIYANLLSILPFLLAGILCSYGVDLSLGRSWAMSLGILACVVCGVYELGRRDGQARK
jgi:hypothetical protein